MPDRRRRHRGARPDPELMARVKKLSTLGRTLRLSGTRARDARHATRPRGAGARRKPESLTRGWRADVLGTRLLAAL